jgi:hypothetical protein
VRQHIPAGPKVQEAVREVVKAYAERLVLVRKQQSKHLR